MNAIPIRLVTPELDEQDRIAESYEQRREGESQVRRVKQYYDITADPRRNRYIATPKASGCCAEQVQS